MKLNTLYKAVEQSLFDNGHRVTSPSGVAKWSGCTASMIGINAARKTDTDSEAAIEGTLAHALLELSVRSRTSPLEIHFAPYIDMDQDSERTLNRILNNEHNSEKVKEFAKECHRRLTECDYTDEMRQEVEKCYQRIEAYRNEGYEIRSELEVSLEPVFGHTHCDGTSDIVAYNPTTEHLIIADLKYGAGNLVSPEENDQATLYGIGTIATLNIQPKKVTLVIMQPRIGNGVWKFWDIPEGYLEERTEFLKVKSIEALQAMVTGEGVYSPSDKACLWCFKKTKCKARYELFTKKVQDIFELAGVTMDTTHELDIGSIESDKLSEILMIAPFAEAIINDAKKELYDRASKGMPIGKFKRVKGKKSRKWDGEEDEVREKFLSSGIDLDQCYNTSFKSVAQMEKVKLNDEQKALIKELTLETYGKPILVPESDKRKTIDDVSAIFKNANIVKEK